MSYVHYDAVDEICCEACNDSNKKTFQKRWDHSNNGQTMRIWLTDHHDFGR